MGWNIEAREQVLFAKKKCNKTNWGLGYICAWNKLEKHFTFFLKFQTSIRMQDFCRLIVVPIQIENFYKVLAHIFFNFKITRMNSALPWSHGFYSTFLRTWHYHYLYVIFHLKIDPKSHKHYNFQQLVVWLSQKDSLGICQLSLLIFQMMILRVADYNRVWFGKKMYIDHWE